jgi:hypothetical protein
MPADRVREHLGIALEDLDHPLDPAPVEPLVLQRRVYDEIFAATATILDLLRRTLFERGGDIAARAGALGVDPGVCYPLTIPGPLEDMFATCMCRPDVVIDEEGPKFVEFNIGGGIGGVVETAMAVQAWLTIYGGAEAAPFAAPDAMAVRDAFFARVANRLSLPPAVLVVGSRRAVHTDTSRHFDVQVDSLRRHGLTAQFAEPEELERFTAPGCKHPFRLGLRYFTILHWGELGIDISPVRRALDDGCLLLTTQTSYAIANKKVMAWLSEGRPWMTSAERSAAARYVPWTRVLEDRETKWREDDHDLVDLLMRRQDAFVIKPSNGTRGQHVLVGRDASPEEWHTRIDAGVASGDQVVQEFVEPVPYRVTLANADGQPFSTYIRPLFGPFLFDGRSASVGVRYLPPGMTSGVIAGPAFGALRTVAMRSRSA